MKAGILRGYTKVGSNGSSDPKRGAQDVYRKSQDGPNNEVLQETPA